MKKVVLKSSVGIISIKLLNALTVLLIVVVAAEQLGPAEYGKYSLLISIFTLMAIPLKNGASTLTIREHKKSNHINENKLADGVQIFYYILFVVLSLLVCVLLFFFNFINKGDLVISLTGVMLYSIGGGYISIVRTYNIIDERYNYSQIPEMIFSPVVILSLLFILKLNDGYELFLANGFSLVLISVVLYLFFGKNRFELIYGNVFSSKSNALKVSALYISAISGAQLINSQIDIYSLAALSSLESVGMYKIANQFASLLFIPVVALSIFVSPKVLSLINDGKKKDAGIFFLNSSVIGFLVSLLLFFMVYFLHRDVIFFLLGDKYLDVSSTLLVLCLGAVVFSIFGPVLGVANMLGLEKMALGSSLISMLINFLLNVSLVPTFGALGAAVATTLSMFLWKVMLSYFILKKWRNL
ncbi:polysaccharide biosynthesis C-terminal domain-containing protein [Vibrio sp. J2-4]|uniref:lipopolysaccharide biosynthesis protein n=1 Tax=Vibrio sp. J2-4 TaxID=1507977 RepID=UPI001F428BB4|nr:polysaccharide biosynthesis C-terminal domain-containing protein [Vibrio sp. J2-4]MCF7478227.1 polysaccharide biosynthesis C-terminal domain-containing protein [Vibrio sp. J2-4]